MTAQRREAAAEVSATAVHIISRRDFLKGAGVAVAVPTGVLGQTPGMPSEPGTPDQIHLLSEMILREPVFVSWVSRAQATSPRRSGHSYHPYRCAAHPYRCAAPHESPCARHRGAAVVRQCVAREIGVHAVTGPAKPHAPTGCGAEARRVRCPLPAVIVRGLVLVQGRLGAAHFPRRRRCHQKTRGLSIEMPPAAQRNSVHSIRSNCGNSRIRDGRLPGVRAEPSRPKVHALRSSAPLGACPVFGQESSGRWAEHHPSE